jgi:hypothetical protein
MLIVTNTVSNASNDKQQLEPVVDRIIALPEELGSVETMLADSGYFSSTNVAACHAAKMEPLIPPGRQGHNQTWQKRFEKPPPEPVEPTEVDAMLHRLKTDDGKKLYALRKQTPEPVFGIIKSVMGFRQFSLRGLDKVTGEWNLVTMAWNIKRMFVLRPA